MPKKSTKKKAGHLKRASKKPAAPLLLKAPSPAALARARAKALPAKLKKGAKALATKATQRRKNATKAMAAFFRSAGFHLALKRLGVAVGMLAALAVLASGLFAGYSYALEDRILPNQLLGEVSYGWRTRDDALAQLRTRLAVLEQEKLTYDVEGKIYRLSASDLGVTYDLERTVDELFGPGHTGSFWTKQESRLHALVSRTVGLPAYTFVDDVVAARLHAAIPEIAASPKEPTVVWKDKAFVAVPGVAAPTTDFPALLRRSAEALATLTPARIPVSLTLTQPQVPDSAADVAKTQADGLAGKVISLVYAGNRRGGPWTISLEKDPTWLAFRPTPPTLTLELDEKRLAEYLESVVGTEIYQEHANARLAVVDPESWRVQVDGRAQDGLALDPGKAIVAVNESLRAGTLSVELPVDRVPGQVLNESGEDLGLRDLLAEGVSDFSNSPAGRDFNVRKGMAIYNGLLIPEGELFSFNRFLGPVDGRHGWKQALTIFQGGMDTRMESGGGICQVSTTVYRAVLEAGLPVTERRAHSYFVSYYAKLGGLGQDATVYPGSQDLVFQNDTPGPILMLAGSTGTRAYVQFYGTKDRSTVLEGPFRSGGSGGGTVFAVDPSLPAGAKVIEKVGHAGFTVSWKQIITYDDTREVKNSIYSAYRAIPAQGRRGPEPGEAPAPAATEPAAVVAAG